MSKVPPLVKLYEDWVALGVPSDRETRGFLSGTLCCCTGYTSIMEGVRLAHHRTTNGT